MPIFIVIATGIVVWICSGTGLGVGTVLILLIALAIVVPLIVLIVQSRIAERAVRIYPQRLAPHHPSATVPFSVRETSQPNGRYLESRNAPTYSPRKPRLERTPILSGTRTKNTISTGLIIRQEPLEKILSGSKTWEMRSRRTTKRETIALIQKGAKAIYGVAEIAECLGPFTKEEMLRNEYFHGITAERLDDPEVSKYRFAWVLGSVKRLNSPVACSITSGAVTFVNLDERAVQALKVSLDGAFGF